MKKQRTSPAISYLLELTIAVFIFALSSIIIISLFTHAHNKQTKSMDINNAVLIAQSIVTELKNQDTLLLEGTQKYSECIQKQEDGVYIAKWSMQMEDFLYEGTLEIWKDDACILSYPLGIEHKEDSL